MAKVNLLAKTTSVDKNEDVEKVALIIANTYDYNNHFVKTINTINKMNRKEISLSLEEIENKTKTLYDYILNYITFVFGIKDISYDGLLQLEDINSVYHDKVNCIFRGRNAILSANIKDLLNFFEEACCSQNGSDLNNIANQMLDICLNEAPNLFRNVGAPCTFGKCDKENSCEKKQNARIKQIIRTY